MRKLLLSSIVLLIFSASVFLFQVSCQKEAKAQTPANNKIVYVKSYQVEIGTKPVYELWIAKADGTNQQKVNITLPSDYEKEISNPVFSPDGTQILFNAYWIGIKPEGYTDPLNGVNILSCNLDGSNVRTIIGNTVSTNYTDYTF